MPLISILMNRCRAISFNGFELEAHLLPLEAQSTCSCILQARFFFDDDAGASCKANCEAYQADGQPVALPMQTNLASATRRLLESCAEGFILNRTAVSQMEVCLYLPFGTSI
jgi:signal transduction protein with GAF and PtsI domain